MQQEFSGLLDGPISAVEEIPQGFLVDCGQERMKNRLLKMDGMEVNGNFFEGFERGKKAEGMRDFRDG